MGITISANGTPLKNPSAYSIEEDSTPIDPSDETGGFGQFTISIPDDGKTELLRGQTITLEDDGQGITQGIADTGNGDETTATITVNSTLSLLDVTRTAQPYSGTLGGYFTYILGLVGITSNYVIDETVTSLPVLFEGWNANCWDQVRALCAAMQVEVTLASDEIVMRPLRGREAINYRNSSVSWTTDDSNIAQSVQAYWYQTQQMTNSLCYPLGGWTEAVQVITVNAGETQTVAISLLPDQDDDNGAGLGASLTTIQQPTCVASVAPTYAAASVYTVVGNDGLPITPAEWAAGGGSMTVAINDDTTSLTLTITGSQETQYAPYQIAMASGSSNAYSSLRLVGTGVFTQRSMLTLQTGHTADEAPTVIGATVDNTFITSYAQAFHAALWTAASWTGPYKTIQVSTQGINRLGDTGSYEYPEMADFNIEFAGMTMAQWNAANPYTNMAAFNAAELASIRSDFANQAFGNMAGARVLYRDTWYRIRTVTGWGPLGGQYTAERDTIMSDFNENFTGLTMAQFNALYPGGITNGDYSTRPLKPLPITYPSIALVPSPGLFPSPSLLPS